MQTSYKNSSGGLELDSLISIELSGARFSIAPGIVRYRDELLDILKNIDIPLHPRGRPPSTVWENRWLNWQNWQNWQNWANYCVPPEAIPR